MDQPGNIIFFAAFLVMVFGDFSDFSHQVLNSCYMLLLFLTFSALVANPKKTTLHGGQSRSWSAEQGKKEKVWQRIPPPPPPPRALLVRRKKINK